MYAKPIALCHNESMLENLRTLAQPYGGDLFLVLIALAVISLAVLMRVKKLLPADQLRRVIRMAALSHCWAPSSPCKRATLTTPSLPCC